MRLASLVAVALLACGPSTPTGAVATSDTATWDDDTGPVADTATSGPDDRPTTADWPSLPKLDDVILGEMASSHVPGLSACILKGGEIAWCGAYGFADLEAQRPVTAQTPFLVASVSKTFAAVALMQAVERGLLDLDAPISSVLPFAVSHPDDPATAITPRMLATHSSGITDNWNIMDEEYVLDADSPWGLDEFLRAYLTEDGSLYHAQKNFRTDGPGQQVRYTNIGAAALALLVEASTGVDFDTWSRDEIFTPLGLEGASWFFADADASELALPYVWRNGAYRTPGHYGFPDYPSGQLRIGAEALSRFLLMFMQDGVLGDVRVLEAETVAEMKRPQVPDLAPDIGLIWYTWDLAGEKVMGHNGGETGASAEILFRPGSDVGVVVMMNAEGRAATLERLEMALLEAADAL